MTYNFVLSQVEIEPWHLDYNHELISNIPSNSDFHVHFFENMTSFCSHTCCQCCLLGNISRSVLIAHNIRNLSQKPLYMCFSPLGSLYNQWEKSSIFQSMTHLTYFSCLFFYSSCLGQDESWSRNAYFSSLTKLKMEIWMGSNESLQCVWCKFTWDYSTA